jgi:hypothetical protein
MKFSPQITQISQICVICVYLRETLFQILGSP